MKPTKMQHKYLLRAALVMLLIAGSYLVLWASISTQNEVTCKESMEECCKKDTDKESSGEMIWETISRQFISTSLSN